MRFGVELDAAEGLPAAVDLAATAEDLGYHFVAVSEHHGGTTGVPHPLLLLAAIAERTSKVRLVSHVVLLPLHHPVLVAEQAAMVQALSGGRVTLGVAQGYASQDFATYGVDRRERVSRMSEALSLLRRLLTGHTVHHDGKHWRGVVATVRPLLGGWLPPPMWGGGWADEALLRLSDHVDAWTAGAMVSTSILKERHGFFSAAMKARRGVQPEVFPVSREMFCAPDVREAVDRGGMAVYRLYRETFMAWGHPMLTKAERRMNYAELAHDRFIIGDPAACADAVERLAAVGVTDVSVRFRVPGITWTEAMASLSLFAREVVPRFTDQRPAPHAVS